MKRITQKFNLNILIIGFFVISTIFIMSDSVSASSDFVTLSTGPEQASFCKQTVSNQMTFSDESWRLLDWVWNPGSLVNADDIAFFYSNGILRFKVTGTNCTDMNDPSQIRCGVGCSTAQPMSAPSGGWWTESINGSATSPDSVTISGVAYETLGNTLIAFGGLDISVVWRDCAPGQRTENGQCVNITGTITATPPSCTAPCNVTIDWESNALSYAKIYRNGVFRFQGEASGINTINTTSELALPEGTYQYCLKGDDGFPTEVNVIDESTGQQACDTVTVTSPLFTYTLTVASTNPVSGVMMKVSPLDKNDRGDGPTQFDRVYNSGTTVTVQAPQTAPNGNNFSGWSGCDSDPSTNPCSVTMRNADKRVIANYSTPPTADIQANASDGPISITYNSPAIISWTSTNADTCSVSSVPPDGSFPSTPNNFSGIPSSNLTSNTIFTLTCNGPGGTATDSVEVRILGVTLTAVPNSGSAPLNNVLLTATPTGTSAGTFRYFFDCNNDGINEREIGDTFQNPYTIDSCSYSSADTYTARVMVYHNGGTAVGKAEVNVSAPGAPTLTLTPNPMNLTVSGPPSNFTLRYDPDGSGPLSSRTVCSGGSCPFSGSAWFSSNASIAAVTQAGRTVPFSAGSTIVTATYSGLTATATVIVTAVPVVPTAPTNLTATAQCSGATPQIVLNWTDNSSNEDGFKIYRDGNLIATLGANVTSYTNTPVTTGTSYSYTVRAYNAVGDSSVSNTASATGPNCAVPVVVPTANLVVNGEAGDDVTITPGGNGSYVWSSTNATTGSSTLTISPSSPDPCGNTNSSNWVITGTSSDPLNPLGGATCPTAGGYTYTIIYTVTGPGGSASDTVTIRLSTVIPPLSSIELDFYADPNRGFSPLNSRLVADVGGTATGPINYYFWWNCTSNSPIVSTVVATCGLLPITAFGSCSTNSVGYRCRAIDAIDADSRQTSTHAYLSAVTDTTYTGKVIVERGGARKEARTTITVTAPNIPPTVSSVTAIQPNYCVSGPAATVNWTYSDPEGNPQSAYQVQVDNIGSAWNLPLTIDTGKILGSGTSYFTGNGIPPWVWNTTYKARVRVWDSNNAVSNWSESGSWTTPKHSYPVVNFTWSPLLDTPANQPIQFTDQTQLFDTSGVGQRAWNWLFGDGGSSAIQNPSHTYSTPGTFNVTETVTDKDGYACALTKPIGIDRPIPIWKEVSPK